MSKTKKGWPQDLKVTVVIQGAEDAAETNSQRPTMLYEAGGKPLVHSVIAAARQVAAPENIYVVVKQDAESVQNAVAQCGVHVVKQEHLFDLDELRKWSANEAVVVLAGDMPLLQPETIEALLERHAAERAAMTILAARDEVDADGCSPAIYVVAARALRSHEKKPNLCRATLASGLREAGESVVTLQAADPGELQHVQTMAELAVVDAVLRAATVRRLMDAGVAIYRPETCVVDADVVVGAGTVIEPFVQLLGKTRIGADCRIRSYSVIEDCSVGDCVIVRQSCVLSESAIANRADIGPFARVRPGCDIGEEAHIGNFVEVKKSKLGRGVKAGHLAYLGDAEVGEKTNIGAGVITCNYDGVHKHMTRIGNGVFVGSDSTLVAPVSIEDGAYVGAGSCITHDVPADALAVGRARQMTKDGWAAARRAKHSAKESN